MKVAFFSLRVINRFAPPLADLFGELECFFSFAFIALRFRHAAPFHSRDKIPSFRGTAKLVEPRLLVPSLLVQVGKRRSREGAFRLLSPTQGGFGFPSAGSLLSGQESDVGEEVDPSLCICRPVFVGATECIFRDFPLAAFVKHDTEAEGSHRVACLNCIPENRLGLLLIATLAQLMCKLYRGVIRVVRHGAHDWEYRHTQAALERCVIPTTCLRAYS
jgi:hypothetical protein